MNKMDNLKKPIDNLDSTSCENTVEIWDRSNRMDGWFHKKYPKLYNFFCKNREDPRIDYSLNLMTIHLGELQLLNNSSSRMSKFFNKTLAHQILKAIIIQNYYKAIKFRSPLVGTPLTEVLVAMGTPPALRTKQRIIDDAVANKYLHRVLHNENSNMKVIVPSDLFIVQHMIEMEARIELHVLNDTMSLATTIANSSKDEDGNSYLSKNINTFLTEKQKTELILVDDIYTNLGNDGE